MQPNESANCHDNANDTMRVDDILRMDATKENEEDMKANIGEGHDHEGGNPWHIEFEEASIIPLFEGSTSSRLQVQHSLS
jgi:hypothetical protein